MDSFINFKMDKQENN